METNNQYFEHTVYTFVVKMKILLILRIEINTIYPSTVLIKNVIGRGACLGYFNSRCTSDSNTFI